MDRQQFDALVSKLEDQAVKQPALYKAKVMFLAALGNVYIGGVLLMLVAILGALLALVATLKALALKLLIFVGAFLWMLIKSLWVTVEPPEGAEIKAGDAPQLFAMINDIRRALRAPRFHHVLITDDFNAAVVQSPRLGIFGWHRNYLLIGLPLMKALTGEQFKAVLAHEFGHLAKGHGSFSNWIYRQRLRWSRLLTTLEQQGSNGSFLFKPFLNWFSPYFNAFSFPLARANEFVADATSVQITSKQAAAEALSSVNIIASYLDRNFWPQVHKLADDQPRPSFMPYANMSKQLAVDIDSQAITLWLDEAMQQQTSSDDTHPALRDRLRAIDAEPQFAPPLPGAAADNLLGPALVGITQKFDAHWQSSIAQHWQRHYEKTQESRQALQALDAKFNAGEALSLQETYDRAMLTESFGNDPESALAQLSDLHRQVPNDAVVCLALGARRISRGDEVGLELLDKAIEAGGDVALQACEIIRNHHWRNGRQEDAQKWHQRLLDTAQVQQAANIERNQLLASNKFLPHELDSESVKNLRDQLLAVDGLRKAYFAKKFVNHFPERPCYVLGFTIKRNWLLRRKVIPEAIIYDLKQISYPGETLIICVEGVNAGFGRKLSKLKSSRIV